MDYIAQSDVEEYLNIALTPDGVQQFNLLRPLLQDMIDQYCNRSWNFSNPVVENFDALSIGGVSALANRSFFVKYPSISKSAANPAYPLAGGIISVIIGTSPLDLNYVVNYGTYVKLAASFPSVLLANPLGFQMVQITYNSDAALTVPPAVKLAFIQWMARFIQESADAGKEVTRSQAGTVAVYYAQGKVGGIPDFVKMVLDQYRLVALDHF